MIILMYFGGDIMLSIESLTNVILSICDDVSNKKLQKLAYYVYAWYLTIYGRKIVDIQFEAWEHGPVCRKLYNRYRCYGWKVIPMYKGFVLADDETIKFIQSVLNVYGALSADDLEELSHKESPWLRARAQGVLDAVISDMEITNCYSKQDKVRSEIVNYIYG